MNVRLHPAADEELKAAAQWYEDRGAGLGERFLDECVDALLRIEHHPRRFGRARYRTSREIRRKLLDHFPYAIVYEVRAEECVVVAVAHVRRRPGYWRERLGS
jgi:toxin ParE1/3/4